MHDNWQRSSIQRLLVSHSPIDAQNLHNFCKSVQFEGNENKGESTASFERFSSSSVVAATFTLLTVLFSFIIAEMQIAFL